MKSTISLAIPTTGSAATSSIPDAAGPYRIAQIRTKILMLNPLMEEDRCLEDCNVSAGNVALDDTGIEYISVSAIGLEVERNIAHVQIAMYKRSFGDSLLYFAGQ